MAENTAAPPQRKDETKIAVVVIHGMGEQKPMQTLRGFVETAWLRHAALFAQIEQRRDHKPWDIWSKPDHVSGSAELRRITTARARDPKGPPGSRQQRCDFFELHWADLTIDTNWGDFTRWLRALLLRNPLRGNVPPRVFVVWLVLWLLVVTLGASTLAAAWPGVVKALGCDPLAGHALGKLLSWRGWAVVAGGLAAFGWATKSFLMAYFGDVARYVSAAPRNIKVRHEARQRGLKLLDELAATGDYERIIIVGHSLGSVLAHDLVMLAWSPFARSMPMAAGSPLHEALRNCEAAAGDLLQAAGYDADDTPFLRDDPGKACRYKRQPNPAQLPERLAGYRRAQRVLFRALAATPTGLQEPPKASSAWLISDVITLGSPLTHAEFLIARNLCDLRTSVNLREVLRCPPITEPQRGPPWRFSYEEIKGSGQWRMHHAAAMAAVRWTNLHDASGPAAFWLGDVISGPVSRDFGPGVVDVNVRIERPRGLLRRLGLARLFTHTLYWRDFLRGVDHSSAPPAHVQALREALNLLDEDSVEDALLQRAAVRTC
jgi:hypothetical protein